MRRGRAGRRRGALKPRRIALLGLATCVALATTVAAQPGTQHGLVSIKLEPPHVRRQIGDVQYLTATGRFADDNYRNITQRVEYRSSNPKVAVAKNERGHKSRIDLVGVGRATISAVDPLTGVTSNEVTVRVGGALARITIKPTAVQLGVGEFKYFTVVGHNAAGGTANLTQRVKYRSSDPSVAIARNRRGELSKVEALAPGTATITAFHPTSKLISNEVTFTVVGALEKITLAPPHPRRGLGEPQHYTATGHYAGGVTRNLTQHVEYTTSDASVATAPNADGNRSRIETRALGTVTISARDPQTGVSSADGGGDAQLTVYDPDAPKPAKKRPTRATADTAAVCGDASGDGALGVSDPLWLLVGAAGLADCPLTTCDVDADQAVTIHDAVTVAWAVAGYDTPLTCPH